MRGGGQALPLGRRIRVQRDREITTFIGNVHGTTSTVSISCFPISSSPRFEPL